MNHVRLISLGVRRPTFSYHFQIGPAQPHQHYTKSKKKKNRRTTQPQSEGKSRSDSAQFTFKLALFSHVRRGLRFFLSSCSGHRNPLVLRTPLSFPGSWEENETRQTRAVVERNWIVISNGCCCSVAQSTRYWERDRDLTVEIWDQIRWYPVVQGFRPPPSSSVAEKTRVINSKARLILSLTVQFYLFVDAGNPLLPPSMTMKLPRVVLR